MPLNPQTLNPSTPTTTTTTLLSAEVVSGFDRNVLAAVGELRKAGAQARSRAFDLLRPLATRQQCTLM